MSRCAHAHNSVIAGMPTTTPERTIGRLCLYRRLLQGEAEKGPVHIYSHQLASLAGVTAAQIRRDLTYVGYTGNPRRGYGVTELRDALEQYLSPRGDDRLALVGVGNLGRAILTHFSGRHRRLEIGAAFDIDPAKVGRVVRGCRCYPMSELEEVVRREDIAAGIIAVPAAHAQSVAELLVLAGVTGILNFAPTSVQVGRNVYVETRDLTTAIEKVAFFSRARQQVNEVRS